MMIPVTYLVTPVNQTISRLIILAPFIYCMLISASILPVPRTLLIALA